MNPRGVFKDCDLSVPLDLQVEHGSAVFMSSPAIDKDSGNEDAAGFWELGPDTHVLAVADGLGGCPGGAEAAAIAIHAVGRAVERTEAKASLRGGIVDAFEDANTRLLEQGIGAATTLVVVEVNREIVRAYHAGDSGAILVGQRGRLRFETIPHSPVGYAVASGLLEQDDTHHHDERHILSNCLGSREMRVELGPTTHMAALDTLFLGTDGVLDNIQRKELINLIRVGPLVGAASDLHARLQATMAGSNPTLPAQPDDATFLVFRRPCH